MAEPPERPSLSAPADHGGASGRANDPLFFPGAGGAAQGGGVYASGSVDLNNVALTANRATGGNGGGIANRGGLGFVLVFSTLLGPVVDLPCGPSPGIPGGASRGRTPAASPGRCDRHPDGPGRALTGALSENGKILTRPILPLTRGPGPGLIPVRPSAPDGRKAPAMVAPACAPAHAGAFSRADRPRTPSEGPVPRGPDGRGEGAARARGGARGGRGHAEHPGF
jgi:hypothetical protein